MERYPSFSPEQLAAMAQERRNEKVFGQVAANRAQMLQPDWMHRTIASNELHPEI